MVDYVVLPPEVNSGRMYAGPGSGALMAAAAAWQALAASYGSSAAAFQQVVGALVGGGWQGPSSISMATAAAPYVVWMAATASQHEEAAAAALQAAEAFEAARAGVVNPAEIAENRSTLATLLSTNFMGCNAIPIAANEADYQRMWGQDSAVMMGYSADSAGIVGSLIPFTPPLPADDPGGMAAQAASVAQAGSQIGSNGAQTFSQSSSQLMGGTLPGGQDASAVMSMGPELLQTLPSVLQGFSSPLSSANPAQSLGQFSSLLSPFMSMFSNPGMFGGGAEAAASIAPALSSAGPAASGGLAGFGGGGSALASLGRAGSIGGLSVPGTWAAGSTASAGGGATPVLSAAARGAVPAAASGTAGAGGFGGAPMAALGGRDRGDGSGPRYGTPVRVLPREDA